MTKDELRTHIGDLVSQLVEHGDAVQILFSRTDGDGTHFIQEGAGNWFARREMARHLLDAEDMQDQAGFIADRISIEDDDSEDWKDG